MGMEQSNEPRKGARRDGGALARVERRRNWSDEEKMAILKETTQPGIIVAAVARRHGIGTGQLYTWRKQLLRGAMAGFVPVELVQPEPAGKMVDTGRIEYPPWWWLHGLSGQAGSPPSTRDPSRKPRQFA